MENGKVKLIHYINIFMKWRWIAYIKSENKWLMYKNGLFDTYI